jgi:DNA mismatch endonuclease (patch repair protein)
MADRITKDRRSWNMAQIRSKNTTPELLVRSALHRMGLRFRLHAPKLPGHPDIVLPRWRVALFVHGCFWHRHPGCQLAYRPKSHVLFWERKFSQNVLRDQCRKQELQDAGWRVVVVWECDARKPTRLQALLKTHFVGTQKKI